MNINQAKLVSFATVLADRQLQDHEINTLDMLAKTVSASCVVNEVENLMRAMREGHKIEAIKAYRTMTASSLLDAKNAVERYYVSQPVEKIQ